VSAARGALGGAALRRVALRQPYFFALVLLVVAFAIYFYLVPNFRPAVISSNLLGFVPLMLLAAGQTVVVIGGGIDLSIGAILVLANVTFIRMLGESPTAGTVLVAAAVTLAAGVLAGALNGFCVAVLRFQPIVTTFATSFVFGGVALYVLPEPGGTVPIGLQNAFYSDPLGIPMFLWISIVVMLLWAYLRSTRYGPYLYASGGRDLAAFQSGVPVPTVKMTSYCIAGLMAGFAGLALTLSVGTGNATPQGGDEVLTLQSIVAVVLGGTRLSGGQGGVLGSLIGVVILSLIQGIVSFAGVPSWWQTLLNGTIVVLALAGPGLVGLFRNAFAGRRRTA